MSASSNDSITASRLIDWHVTKGNELVDQFYDLPAAAEDRRLAMTIVWHHNMALLLQHIVEIDPSAGDAAARDLCDRDELFEEVGEWAYEDGPKTHRYYERLTGSMTAAEQ